MSENIFTTPATDAVLARFAEAPTPEIADAPTEPAAANGRWRSAPRTGGYPEELFGPVTVVSGAASVNAVDPAGNSPAPRGPRCSAATPSRPGKRLGAARHHSSSAPDLPFGGMQRPGAG